MKERPILFSAPMVRSILADTKSQTRRIVKPQPNCAGPIERGFDLTEVGVIKNLCGEVGWRSPYGVPGDRLWVKETWRPRIIHSHGMDACDCASFSIRYNADGAVEEFWDGDARVPEEWLFPKAAERGNVTPLFMPRWASRITLEVTEVRVERLCDLSEEDAKAEGVDVTTVGPPLGDQPVIEPSRRGRDRYARRSRDTHPHTLAFGLLWDTINGDRVLWSEDPCVWVVAFKRVQAERRAA